MKVSDQSARSRVVATAFKDSWETMAALSDWWPGPAQVECARLLRETGDPSAALQTDDYVTVLTRSLVKWRAFRGAPINRERVETCLRSVAPLLGRWRGATILSLQDDDYSDLFDLFDALRDLKPTQRKWVATSKALHHLLPDLIVPMDNQMTAPFLGRGSLPAHLDAAFLAEAYGAFTQVALDKGYGIGSRRIRDAAREVPWPCAGALRRDCHVGVARVIDFAIAGFVLRHGRAHLRLTPE